MQDLQLLEVLGFSYDVPLIPLLSLEVWETVVFVLLLVEEADHQKQDVSDFVQSAALATLVVSVLLKVGMAVSVLRP